MSTAAQAQAGRNRARESRLKAARERRLRVDPDQLARETRIDEATVDVEMAWVARAEAERALESAEVAAAEAVERLLSERLSVASRGEANGVGSAHRAAAAAGQGRPCWGRHEWLRPEAPYFTATAANQLWVAHFSHVATFSGTVYVASVVDVFSRLIVGWRAATSMTTDLVPDTLEMAIWKRGRGGMSDLCGLVHHNDAGSHMLWLPDAICGAVAAHRVGNGAT